MARITVEHQEERDTFPVDSILHLKIDELEVREQQGRNGTWQKLEFKFKILGVQVAGDGGPVDRFDSWIGQHIWGSVPFRLTDSTENKLRLWCEAILGQELGVGFELDTDFLEGREVRGVVSQYEKKNKDPKTGLPFKAHQIEQLLPKGQITTGQPAATSAPAAQSAPPAGQDPWATPASWGSGDEPPF